MSAELITKSRLIQDLKSLGLSAGQTVMLHVSVKNLGWIVGGPDMVLHALLEVLGPAGTLMMLASWEDNPYELADWPESKRLAYLAEGPAYDPARSRADWREMSILSEYLRTWPGAERSRHPFSYVAVGAHADWITRDQPWQYRDGHDSPLARLCELNGSVLLLGSPLANVTLLHHAEFLAQVPNKRIDRYSLPVLLDGQRVWMDFEEFDTTNGIVDWHEDYFESIVKAYLAKGYGQCAKVGAADSQLFKAADLRDFGIAWMEKHFA